MTNSSRITGRRVRSGFTLLETIIVLIVIAMMAVLVMPKVSSAIGHSRVQNSAGVIAGDLQLAFSLAGRQRTPLRITVDPSGSSYTIATRSGTVIRQRDLGPGMDLSVTSMTSTATTVDIFPNGLASGPISITIAVHGYEQTISMTRAGQVRVTS